VIQRPDRRGYICPEIQVAPGVIYIVSKISQCDERFCVEAGTLLDAPNMVEESRRRGKT